MLVIGLAGGIASGKSLVADCFMHFGATLIDADRIGHEILKQATIKNSIVLEFGNSVIDKENEINRTQLAKIVFNPNDPNALKTLEKITHPVISERIHSALKQHQSSTPAVLLDAPVMFKAGWDQMCDKVVFVDANLATRKSRAKLRGWSSDELAKRESFQTPVEEKRNLATNIIDNGGSKNATYLQARDLWRSWNLPLAEKHHSPDSLFTNTP
ncbi:MAG: dephospho-CoA kinase [Planctomycetaceae bacterium]|nr:dephospho-CoA kinase [Planctomycetaceae bacterium]MCP4479669.1 dephospho-CoA kinase [Planctomycetaceae bacterium]